MLPDFLKSTKVTVPVVLLLGLFWLGFQADDLTVSTLSRWFVTKVDAQENATQVQKRLGELDGRISGVERQIEGVDKKVDAQRIGQIEQEVFQLRTEQCMIVGTPLGNLKLERITTLIAEWRRLTGSSDAPTSFVDCRNLQQ